MAVAHCSEPCYPAMTDKSPLCNVVLTRIGTGYVFGKEKVIFNRMYLVLAFHVWLFLGRLHVGTCALVSLIITLQIIRSCW